MNFTRFLGGSILLLTCLCSLTHAQQTSPAANMRPEVATLLKQATDAYQHMHTYRHTAELLQRDAQGQIVLDRAYTLALERPNKFCYRSESNSATTIVCDGQYCVNYDGADKTFLRTRAPASISQIDFVSDVTFDGIASYLVTLMLQGNALTDPDIAQGLSTAGPPTTVNENGKSYRVISFNLPSDGSPISLYFDSASHLLHKSVIKQADQAELTEIIENVKIDQPIPSDIFQFVVPAGAHWITMFSVPSLKLALQEMQPALRPCS